MKILFLSDNFPPEVNAPATRSFEHIKHWQQLGAEVTVITCFPNFPQGKLYEGYRNGIYQIETLDGIKVVRVFTYITANKGTIKRTLDYISFMLSASIAGLFFRTDLIVATSPQFFTALAGRFLSLVKRKPWLLEVRDIWPESIKVVTGMKDNWLIKFFEFLELRMYQKASKIVVVTDSFKNILIEKRGVPEAKIKVITNGVNLKDFSPRLPDLELKESLNLQDKFVVAYMGTHGLAHGLDFILRAAQKVSDPMIHFLFVGDGAMKTELIALKTSLNLSNVSFLDPIAKNEMPRYLSIIDVGLVNLMKSSLFTTVIPSKIFEIASMQKPILLGLEGETKDIIEKYGAGLCFEPENEDDFLKNLELIKTRSSSYQEGSSQLAASYNRKTLAIAMLDFMQEKG